MLNWPKEARSFLSRHRTALEEMPVGVFTLGLTDDKEKDWQETREQLEKVPAEIPSTLYRLGGLAVLLTLTFYVSQFVLIRWDQYPASTEEWVVLFERSRLLGLFYMNALDILSMTLLGVMFLTLLSALKPASPSWMTVAGYSGLLGVGVFVAPRVAMLSMLPLAEHYAVTTDELSRTRLLTAGETLGSLGTATPQTIGFLFIAVAVFVMSIIMLRFARDPGHDSRRLFLDALVVAYRYRAVAPGRVGRSNRQRMKYRSMVVWPLRGPAGPLMNSISIITLSPL